MQRMEDGGIIISCDFCGTDWDQELAMVEGHHGSVLCLDCLKKALANSGPAATVFDCTLCLQTKPAGTTVWRHEPLSVELKGYNRYAAVCEDCVDQAARAFSKDPQVDFSWQRKAK
ncbi:MAG: hypothetical protein IT443_01660 [Phycisphaeraceae bacterium]|nr:hypothetical protein [Phycisphaeraceae bacterium]